jgi:hypothetical protein
MDTPILQDVNHWDETEKAFELATSLRGPAQSVLTDLCPEMRVNYLHLTSALSSRFQPENQAEMDRQKLPVFLFYLNLTNFGPYHFCLNFQNLYY